MSQTGEVALLIRESTPECGQRPSVRGKGFPQCDAVQSKKRSWRQANSFYNQVTEGPLCVAGPVRIRKTRLFLRGSLS